MDDLKTITSDVKLIYILIINMYLQYKIFGVDNLSH